jgi:hypothetical protein
MKRALKRAGAAAFFFFLVKGLAWLVVLAATALWAGGAGPAGPAVLASPAAAGADEARGAARLLPMRLGTVFHSAVETGEAWIGEIVGEGSMVPVGASLGLITLLLLILFARRTKEHRDAIRAQRVKASEACRA